MKVEFALIVTTIAKLQGMMITTAAANTPGLEDLAEATRQPTGAAKRETVPRHDHDAGTGRL